MSLSGSTSAAQQQYGPHHPLPHTGADVGAVAGLGGGLILAGVALAVVARRWLA